MKLFFESKEGYRPSITQRIEQFFRCKRGNHIYINNAIIEKGMVIGYLKECEHCGKQVKELLT